MNYKLIHDDIIKRAEGRHLNGYVERHHVLPKCIGGEDNITNLVELTAKEHYIVHKLLTIIYPEKDCLKYAFWMMSHRVKGAYVGGRVYVQTRQFIIDNFRNNVGSPEAIKKMSKSRKGQKLWEGKKHTSKTKLKMSKSAFTRKIKIENEALRRKGISEGHKGKILSAEHRDRLSKSKLGKNNPMYGLTGNSHHNSKKVEQYDLKGQLIKEWPNARVAAGDLKLNYKAINRCCNEKSKTSGGFSWKFK